MKSVTVLSALLVSSFVVLASRIALADDRTAEGSDGPRVVPATDVSIGGGFGASAVHASYRSVNVQTDETFGALSFEGHALARHGIFTWGGIAEADAMIGYTSASFNAAAGVTWQVPSGYRFELLGMAGPHFINGLGGGLLSSGASGTLPSVGARGGVSYVWKVYTLGVSAFARTDIGNISGNVTSSGLLGDAYTSEPITGHTSTLGALLTLSATLGH